MPHVGTALIDPYIIFQKIGLSQGMRVADFGCGRTGHFIFPASRTIGDTGVVYAVDVMKEILESIKSRIVSEGYDNIQTVWSDIEVFGKTPIPEKSLDVCFIVNVACLLKKRAEAVREAGRLLKENGFLVIVDWRKKVGLLGPAPESLLKPEDLANIGQSAGLKAIENGAAGDYHFYIILKKA